MKKVLSFFLCCCFIFNSMQTAGCPDRDGAVVYQARVLLNVLYDRYLLYPDNCPAANSARTGNKEQEKTNSLDDGMFDAVLFPNPGASTFNIATFGLTDGDIDVAITDMTGKEVFNSKLNVVNALSLFNLDVKNGVYFVKIRSSNKTIIKKLIVQN